jgi:hypothetical protein
MRAGIPYVVDREYRIVTWNRHREVGSQAYLSDAAIIETSSACLISKGGLVIRTRVRDRRSADHSVRDDDGSKALAGEQIDNDPESEGVPSLPRRRCDTSRQLQPSAKKTGGIVDCCGGRE